MKSAAPQKSARGALALIEEAVQLLRHCPASVFAPYYIGSMPFVLGGLYFCSEMTSSAMAARRGPEAAMGMALLFAWMKMFQTVFVRQLWAAVSGGAAPRLPLGTQINIAISQIFLQAMGVVLVPLAALIALPFGWVYAFFQSALVAGGKGETDAGAAFNSARRQAALWPTENHVMLTALSGFALFVFVNLVSGALFLPYLLKTLFGVETVFSESIMAMFNSTFIAAMCGLTYLCVDPIVKTVYVLRCFYGESLQSGADIHAELKRLGSAAKLVVIALLAACCLCPATTACAEESPSESSQPAQPAELNRSINEVLERPKFAWRLPRPKKEENDAGLLEKFFTGLTDTLSRWLKPVGKWIKAAFEWLVEKLFPQGSTDGQASGSNWAFVQRGLIYFLLAAVAVVLAILSWRILKRRRAKKKQPAVEAVAAKVDLADEEVVADLLPEDEWLALSKEMLQKGDFRLALRALYLASLARLAARNVIAIAKFKSNREYEAELRRRAHARPELYEAFGENVTLFERAWYGMHEVTPEALGRFNSNFERLKA